MEIKNHTYDKRHELSCGWSIGHEFYFFLRSPGFLARFGPFTKHQSTLIFCPKISAPSIASLAANACLYVSYSTSAYPFKNPVRLSRFK